MKPSVITVTLNPAIDKTVTVGSIELGQLNRIKEVRTDAGGKGINVAKVLRHFEAEVSAWGITAGYQGNVIRDILNKSGIPSRFLEAEGETRTNMKVVDEAAKQTTEFNEPGIHVSEALLQKFVEELTVCLDGVKVLVLAGSLPPGAPPDSYKKLIEAAAAKGVRTVLDADGEAFVIGLEGKPYAVKPNIHELEAYLGRSLNSDSEVIGAARELIRRGVCLVQISMGGSGSMLVDSQGAYRAKPFPITPLSTVGAGDSMVAAMVYGLLKGMGPEEIARLSSAAGTVTASKPGTQVCTLKEVESKLALVELSRV
jgi:1-phosphofructokinase